MLWTAPMDKLLKAHFKDGLSASASATLINNATGLALTRNAVIGRRARLGLLAKATPRVRSATGVTKPTAQIRYAIRYAKDLPKRLQALKEVGEKMREAVAPRPTFPKAEGINIPLLDLKDHHCRFIVTDDHPHLYCGLEKQAGSSYCEAHHSRVWQSARAATIARKKAA